MIVTDESKLRVKCSEVLPEEVEELRDKLEEELRLSEKMGNPGIGLAAPQIGIAKKMAIVRIPASHVGKEIKIDLVNCEIVDKKGIVYIEEEGCLSFPGRFAKTERYKEIVISKNLVEPHNFVVTGLASICCQHELDHLQGILLSDVALDW